MDDNNSPSITFMVSVSRTYKNKTGYEAGGYKLNKSFRTEQHTPESFVEKVIKQGWPYTMVHLKRSPQETGAAIRGVSTAKHKENFVSSQLLTGDDDGKKAKDAIEFWRTDPFFSRYGYINVESVNSVPGVVEKCHPTLLFDRPIEDSELYKECLQAFCTYYPRCDWLVNIDRTIYNAVGATVHYFGNICPFEVFEREILEPYRKAEKEKKAAIEAEKEKHRQAWELSLQNGHITPSSVFESYLRGYISWVFQHVANCGSGTNRNTKILWAGRTIAGIQSTDWAASFSHLWGDVENEIVNAASKNGYLDEYAHGDKREVIRIFNAGILAGGEVIEPPVMEEWFVFDVGEEVTAVTRNGEIVYSGMVTSRKRPKTPDGQTYSGYQLNGSNVVYAETMLRRGAMQTDGRSKLVTENDSISQNGRVAHDDEELRHFFLTASGDHEGHAQCTLKWYRGKFHHSSTHGWMFYNGRFWQTDGAEAAVERAVTATLIKRRELAAAIENKGLLNHCWGDRRNVVGTRDQLKKCAEIKVDIADFDKNKDELNCNNGVLCLRTGILKPHTPEQKFSYAIPTDYDPEALSIEWLKFIDIATNTNRDLRNFLQLAIGYSLTGHTNEEVLFYIYGPPRSGKGTFTESLLATLGFEPMSTEVDFETFTAKRFGDNQNFDLAPLKPCRLLAASESNRESHLNAAKIKQLTGGNLISCSFKRKDRFSYRPQYKIWLSSNHKVNVDVDDDAAWGRVKVVTFPNSHMGQEDKQLKARMLNKDNLAGILAWAVEGAISWYTSSNGLVVPDVINTQTKEHRQMLDYVQLFIDEKLHKAPDVYESSTNLYMEYKGWCEECGLRPMFQRGFSMSLDAKGYKLDRKMIAQKQQRVVLGLALASSV